MKLYYASFFFDIAYLQVEHVNGYAVWGWQLVCAITDLYPQYIIRKVNEKH
jgi:hypothetical protein